MFFNDLDLVHPFRPVGESRGVCAPWYIVARDACTKGETVLDTRIHEVIASVPPLPEDRFYAEGQALLELVRRERLEFPEVFLGGGTPGFAAVLGNPPWDKIKPDKKEFY